MIPNKSNKSNKAISKLAKIVLVILLLAIPAYCCEIYIRNEDGEYILTIDNVTNVGVCDLNLTYDSNLVNITDVIGERFDHFDYKRIDLGDGKNVLRTQAFQINNPGLSGLIDYAILKLQINDEEQGEICIGVIEIVEDSPEEVKPIPHTVRNFTTIAAPSSTSPTTSTSRGSSSREGTYPPDGGATPTSSPLTSAAPAVTPAATPVEVATPSGVAATPEPARVTEFRTEPKSPPSPILTPIAGIVIVVIASIMGGIVKVISLTTAHPEPTGRETEGGTDAEAVAPVEERHWKKSLAAIVGIVVIAVVAIIVIAVV